MTNCSSSLAYTHLVEPTSNVTQSPPAEPFDPVAAYLMGQCCSLTYVQFDAGLNWKPDFSSLTLPGYTITASGPTQFTVYEANMPGATTGDAGNYYQVPAGFAVQLTLTPTGGNSRDLIVVALRGTRTWEEWINDTEAFPVAFASDGLLSDGLGSVHSGFYGVYTTGTNGEVSTSPLSRTVSKRAQGSIAYQIGEYVSNLSGELPIYVTGHSLGAALATLCALDIAYNFAGKFSQLYMYSLASPRVAVGISDSFGIPIPTLDNQVEFLAYFQTYVPNSYQIVNAADIVPILPPISTTLGPLILSCAQVTDPYQFSGSGATATATVEGGAVNSVAVNTEGSGYLYAPMVVFSGGGGSGAIAQAVLEEFLGLPTGKVQSVTIIYGGTGYSSTSAPTVQLVTGASLSKNVINFCAQTGDIGCNHGCTNTYVPYLAQLAAGFEGS